MTYYLRNLTSGLILLFCLGACADDNDATQSSYVKATVQYKNVTGVDANLLSLDVYYVAQSNSFKPVVVYVHGGAWAIGDKANSIDNKKNLFEAQGYLFVSVNYRLSPSDDALSPNRIKFPVHNEDVADAVKWVFDNIEQYGGDPDKIALLGHSAGAHLVSLTGLSGTFLPARGISRSMIKGVASIDTEGYDVVSQVQDQNLTYINAFGTVEEELIAASPIRNILTDVAYPRFFVARRGSATRLAIADAFINALTNAGVPVSTVTAQQYDHEGINDAIGAPGETAVTTPLLAFFETCFN